MIEKIAYNLGRNDEEPNIDLAIELCNTKDPEGIKEIVNGLKSKKAQIAIVKNLIERKVRWKSYLLKMIL